MQAFRIEPPLFHRTRFEILDHDVGIGQQLAREFLTLGDAQVRADGTLVATDHFPPDLVLAVAPLAHRIADLWRFDLDDVGPHVAHQLAAEWPGNQLAHLDDLQPFEGTSVLCNNYASSPFGNPPALASIDGNVLPITSPSQCDVPTSASKSTPVATPDRSSR